MAHAAKISVLTDDLITSVTTWTPHEDGRKFRQAKDATYKTFKAHQHVRVNQFDIHSRLEGLAEKFFVLNNEPLADALKSRLDELATKASKWKPEILALLLGLSDRPVEKTDVDEALKVNVPEPIPQLTWAEIIADDPLTEEGVWDDVEIDSDYSDHYAPSLSDASGAEHTTSTQASSVGEEDMTAFARTFLVSRDTKALDEVKAVRSKLTDLRHYNQKGDLSEKNTLCLTELQATREVISMLHGLPSDLFDTSDPGRAQMRSSVRIASIAPSTFGQVMQSFVQLGCQLSAIRKFAASHQHYVVFQRLQAAMQQRLRPFGKALSNLEQNYISPGSPAVVSLISVHAEIHHIARPLIQIAHVLPDEDSPSNMRTLHVLDKLFEEACTLQLVGEDEQFASIARLFFECLEVYLRPIRRWMIEGKLQDSDEIFFVRSSGENTDRGSIWHSRFTILRTSDGSVCAPLFVQQMVERIFKAGKSVMFLEALGRRPGNSELAPTSRDLSPESIIGSMVDTLLPFSGVFNNALDQWVNALEIFGTQSLRHILMSQCGLQTTMRAVEHLFLGRNGAQFQLFAQSIFARIDRSSSWDDRFLLTELAHDAFGVIDAVDLNHLSIRIKPRDSRGKGRPTRQLSEELDRVILEYSITWSLQNVLTQTTLSTCQQIFSILLRIYRAQYVLTQHEWTLSVVADHTKDQRIKKILGLRQHLSWFVGVFRGYANEMISLAMKQVSKNLDLATDVDGIATAFTRFNNDLAGKLLMTEDLEPIRRALIALLDLCEDLGFAWKDTIKRISERASKPTSRHLIIQQTRASNEATAAAVDDTADFSADEDEFEAGSHLQRSVSDIPGLLMEYERQLSFALAGLRGVSRVEAEPAWITLSERLQWGAEALGKR